MGQSLAQIYLHIVFSTKHRQPLIRDEVRENLYGYLAGICKNLNSPTLSIGGVEDHVHLLCRLDKTVGVSTLVRETKKESSEWAKRELAIREFYWQTGYGAFSVSPGHVDRLRAYIANQKEHHRDESFQDEFRRLCAIYEIEIDERYVWS